MKYCTFSEEIILITSMKCNYSGVLEGLSKDEKATTVKP